MNTSLLLQLSKDTLLLIPCSGKKQPESNPSNARSILSVLDPVLANALKDARAKLSEKIKEEKKPKEAPVDEKTLMPAYLRYSGQLYKHGSAAIGAALAVGQRVLIVSGAYGVVLANEPIGRYNKRLVVSDWPDSLLEKCILDYARHEEIQSIIAVMARTGNYQKLVRKLRQENNKLSREKRIGAIALVSPDSRVRDVSQTSVRIAQGQAIADLLNNNGLEQDWRSRGKDKLSLIVKRWEV